VTLARVWIASPNYSSRGGSGVRLAVIHTAEGALTYQSLGSFFANPSSGVSSHVGIDDTANTVGEYVTRGNKAWTQGNANPVAVAAELCAFAAWTPAEWDRHPNMLANCAAWLAEEAAAFGIPLVRLTPAQAQGAGRGVCAHSDLGSWGGNHSDPGVGFPMDRVISMAAGGAPAPGPSPTEEVEMFLAYATNDSTHDNTIKRNNQYVVRDTGISAVATPADSNALQAKLGPLVGLSGNMLNSLK
jgi:hypothetical protein